MATQAPAYSQPGYPPIGQDPPAPQYPPAGPPPAQYPPAGPPPAQYNKGYPPQPQPPTVVVVNAGSSSIRFTKNPMSMTCPNCHSQILTSVSYEEGTLTWILCLVLFFFTGICCFIPFLVNDCKNAIHQCPSCNRQLGRRNAM